MLRGAGVVALVWCMAAVPAAAECDAPQTQAEITACAARDGNAADAALNAAYRQAMARLRDDDRQRLRDAQRAWLQFRDRECSFRTHPYADGSVHATARAACVTALTRERVGHLLAQLNCAEGDISCVPQVAAPPGATEGSSNGLDHGACVRTAGPARAQELVDRCMEVSSSSHPPCNAQNPCAMMIEEIRSGCAQSGADAPAYCSSYR